MNEAFERKDFLRKAAEFEAKYNQIEHDRNKWWNLLFDEIIKPDWVSKEDK